MSRESELVCEGRGVDDLRILPPLAVRDGVGHILLDVDRHQEPILTGQESERLAALDEQSHVLDALEFPLVITTESSAEGTGELDDEVH